MEKHTDKKDLSFFEMLSFFWSEKKTFAKEKIKGLGFLSRAQSKTFSSFLVLPLVLIRTFFCFLVKRITKKEDIKKLEKKTHKKRLASSSLAFLCFPFLLFLLTFLIVFLFHQTRKILFLNFHLWFMAIIKLWLVPSFLFCSFIGKKKELMPNYNLLINNKEETFEVDFKKDNNQNIY